MSSVGNRTVLPQFVSTHPKGRGTNHSLVRCFTKMFASILLYREVSFDEEPTNLFSQLTIVDKEKCSAGVVGWDRRFYVSLIVREVQNGWNDRYSGL